MKYKQKKKNNILANNDTINNHVIKSSNNSGADIKKEDIGHRYQAAIPFKECTNVDENDIILDQYEIIRIKSNNNNSNGNNNGNSNNNNNNIKVSESNYIALHHEDSEYQYIIIGMIKKEGHINNRQLVKCNYFEVSLQYDLTNKKSWCYFVHLNTPHKHWLKLGNPHQNYLYVYETFQHLFLQVMHTADYFMKHKEKKNRSNTSLYQGLTSHLKLNIPSYKDGDIDRNRTYILNYVDDLVDDEHKSKITKLFNDIKARETHINNYQKYAITHLFGDLEIKKQLSEVSKANFKKYRLADVEYSEIEKSKHDKKYFQTVEDEIKNATLPKTILKSKLPGSIFTYQSAITVKSNMDLNEYDNADLILPSVPSTDTNEFNYDVIPFLECKVCNRIIQLNEANLTSNEVPINSRSLDSLRQYILHMENHKNQLLSSELESDHILNLQTRAMVNQFRIRTMVETIHQITDEDIDKKTKIYDKVKEPTVFEWPKKYPNNCFKQLQPDQHQQQQQQQQQQNGNHKRKMDSR